MKKDEEEDEEGWRWRRMKMKKDEDEEGWGWRRMKMKKDEEGWRWRRMKMKKKKDEEGWKNICKMDTSIVKNIESLLTQKIIQCDGNELVNQKWGNKISLSECGTAYTRKWQKINKKVNGKR